ncbi:MAG: hypothetical protein FWD82_03810 [Defluviitaleaceae bacterium]|nr:hypothetical protein [Defluviitaleaceae bacterium]
MPNNFSEILKNEAFANLEPEKLEAIKNMHTEIQGKSTIEALQIFSKYNTILKQGEPISNEQRDLMLSVILDSMDEKERKKVESVMKLIKFSV